MLFNYSNNDMRKISQKKIINEISKFVKTIFQDILQNMFHIITADIYLKPVNMNIISILL